MPLEIIIPYLYRVRVQCVYCTTTTTTTAVMLLLLLMHPSFCLFLKFTQNPLVYAITNRTDEDETQQQTKERVFLAARVQGCAFVPYVDSTFIFFLYLAQYVIDANNESLHNTCYTIKLLCLFLPLLLLFTSHSTIKKRHSIQSTMECNPVTPPYYYIKKKGRERMNGLEEEEEDLE